MNGIFAAAVLSLTNPTVAAIVKNGLAQDEDQFAEQIAPPPLSDPVILVPFTDGRDRYPSVETNAFYVYRNGRLELKFRTDSESDILDTSIREPITYWNEIIVLSKLTRAGSFFGQNAYGTKATVTAFDKVTLKVAFGEGRERAIYSADLAYDLTGADAERLARNARVEITLASPDALSAKSKCSYLRNSASIDHPEQVDHLECVVRADVSSIRVIRADTGEVLSVIKALPSTG